MRRSTTLSPLSRGWIARVGLIVLLGFGFVPLAYSQTTNLRSAPETKSYNTELRRHTWSIYTQAGTSWARGVAYTSINAKRSYEIAPAVGGGVDFTIQPWVRVGGEYLWSRYRREQRITALDARKPPVKTYGNYLMNFHRAQLGVQFNLLELWPRRGAQWLNVWVGTGAGYMWSKGNEFSTSITNTKTTGGKTTPLLPDETISNDASVTVTGNVRSVNRHEKFDTYYVPATLHVEADVSRQFTLGLKGQMDWVLGGKDIAPTNLIYALATVRYNFVPSLARVQRARYEGELNGLNAQMNALRQEAEAEKARADREASDRARLEQERADLERRLRDCESEQELADVLPAHFVQFDHNSSYMSRAEAARLRAFAQSARGKKLSLVAEASTPGTDGYNQALSERRLQRVMDALIKEGFAPEDLHPTTAIGERNGKPRAEGRRVTITIEHSK